MKLLFVNCCISQRGGASRTKALADAFLTAFRASHPGAEVEEVTPEALLALKPFNAEMLNRRDALAAALNTAFAPDELTLAGLHTGLNLLAKLKDPPPDAALRCAAEAEGVQLSLLSDYDLTGEAPSAAGTLVLGYGSLKDEACASVGETLKKVCMAAREASVTV